MSAGPSDVLNAGLALVELGQSVARGEVPNPLAIAKAIQTVAAVLVDDDEVEELKSHLDSEARRRADIAAELAGVAWLGPRPR